MMSTSGRTLAFLKMARHSVIRPRIVPHAMVVLFLVLSILIHNGNFSTCAFQSTSIPCTKRNNVHAPLRVDRINPLLLATSVNPTDRTDDVSQVVSDDNDDTVMIGTVQILMSDTGGGHRASAIALQDAFNTLYSTTTTNTKIECDIVDIYTEYGPVWPYNDYVSIYKYMAAHPWMWKLLYEFGQSDFGLWFNQFMLEWWCTEAFTKCLARIPPPTTADRTTTMTRRRADLIISVHPLTQDLPLKIVSKLDHLDGSSTRTTPFVTVVTDLGSAHPTWFHPGYAIASLSHTIVPDIILSHIASFWNTLTYSELTNASYRRMHCTKRPCNDNYNHTKLYNMDYQSEKDFGRNSRY